MRKKPMKTYAELKAENDKMREAIEFALRSGIMCESTIKKLREALGH